MELEPYKKIVRSIVVQALTQTGWQNLVRIPIDTPEKASPKEIQTVLEQLHKLFYKSEKVELSVQGIQLYIPNLDKATMPLRVCASYNAPDGPQTVP